MSSVIRSLTAKFGADLSKFSKDVQNAAIALKDGFGNLDVSQTDSAIKGLNQSIKLSESEFKKAVAGMDDWESNIDGLKARTIFLNDALEDQRAVLDGLNRKLQLTTDKYGEGSKEVNDLKIKINNQTAAIKDNKSELDKVTNKLDNFGKETDQAAEKGGLLSKIFAGGFLANIATQALNAVTNKIKEFATQALTTGDTMSTLADTTGLTAERLQALQYAGTRLDVSLETMTGSFKKLINNMAGARDGLLTPTAAFKKLGISVVDSTGQLRDSNVVFGEVIEALGEMANETERDAAAQDILGKSGTDLNPIIKAGSKELERLAEEAENVGAVMSKDAIDALDNLGETLEQTKQKAVAFVGEALASIISSGDTASRSMEKLAASLGESKSTGQLISQYKKLKLELEDTSLSEAQVIAKTSELNDIKQQLIEVSDGVITALDLENGTFDAQVGALEKVTESQKKFIKYKLEALALDNTGAGAKKRATTAEEKYLKVQEKLNAALDEQAKAQQLIIDGKLFEGGINTAERLEGINGSIEYYTKALRGATEAQRDGAESMAAGEAAIASLVNNGFMTAEEACREFGMSAEELNAILGDTSGMSDEVKAKGEEIKASIDSVTAEIDVLAAAYKSAYDSALSSIQGQNKLFSDLDEKGKVTSESLADSLQKQADALAAYNENLEKAKKNGINTDLLTQVADGSQASATKLAAMAEATPAQVEAINSAYADLAAQEISYATTMAKTETDFDNSMSNIQARIDEAVAESNKYADMYTNGQNAAQGLIDGMDSKMRLLRNTARKMATAVEMAIAAQLAIYSPSRVTMKQGEHVGDGLGIGIKNRLGFVTDQMGDVTDAVKKAARMDLGAPTISASMGQYAAGMAQRSDTIDSLGGVATPDAANGTTGQTLTVGGEITVRGVNDQNETVGITKMLAEEMNRDARRRPSGVSFSPI